MSQEDRKDVDGVKGVFVTVGTTEFDDLIRASTTNEFYQVGKLLAVKGCVLVKIPVPLWRKNIWMICTALGGTRL